MFCTKGKTACNELPSACLKLLASYHLSEYMCWAFQLAKTKCAHYLQPTYTRQ